MTDTHGTPAACGHCPTRRGTAWQGNACRYQRSTVSRRLVGRGRLLAGLRDRPDPAALASRLRRRLGSGGGYASVAVARVAGTLAPSHHVEPGSGAGTRGDAREDAARSATPVAGAAA